MINDRGRDRERRVLVPGERGASSPWSAFKGEFPNATEDEFRKMKFLVNDQTLWIPSELPEFVKINGSSGERIMRVHVKTNLTAEKSGEGLSTPARESYPKVKNSQLV